VHSVLEKARHLIGKCRGLAAAVLIRKPNPLLRGWANCHRHVVSKRVLNEAASRREEKRIWQLRIVFSDGDLLRLSLA
jgi:RNA-directed DNA polymerase